MSLPRSAILIGGMVAAAVWAAIAAGAGPAPGVVQGASGVTAPNGTVRYVTIAGREETIVEAVSTRSGRVLWFRSVPGRFGIPMVALDGTVGGLSADGNTLVLAPAQYGQTISSRFLVLNTTPLKVRASFTLPGSWSYDALSPDGRTVYLIQYRFSADNVSYHVRAYDLVARRLLKQVIADKSEKGEAMTGSPITRVSSSGGTWVYTLYARPGKPFIHALDAARRAAVCIDLPWTGSDEEFWKLRLSLSKDGSRLVVRKSGGAAAAVVDTKTFRVVKG